MALMNPFVSFVVGFKASDLNIKSETGRLRIPRICYIAQNEMVSGKALIMIEKMSWNVDSPERFP